MGGLQEGVWRHSKPTVSESPLVFLFSQASAAPRTNFSTRVCRPLFPIDDIAATVVRLENGVFVNRRMLENRKSSCPFGTSGLIEPYIRKMASLRRGLLMLGVFLLQGWLLSQQGPATESSSSKKTPEDPKTTHVPVTKPTSRGLEPLPTGAPTLTSEQIRGLIQQVAENDIENNKKERNYTYVERQEEYHLDGKGAVKSTESKTSDVMMLYGEQVERLIAKNDKPLSEKEAAKEDEKVQKIIDKRKRETEEERRKRLETEEKRREQDREFVRDVSDAYNFRLVGIEPLEGRDTYVIDAQPRLDFQPQRKDAKLLTKFRFRIWIDKVEKQWVKLNAECIDTVSWGLFVARIHKGSRILIETTRVNDEVWLPKHVDVKVDARLALLKNLNEDIDLTYRDYKKFRTDTRIVGVEGALEGR